MNTHLSAPKHKLRFRQAILTVRNAASWATGLVAWWKRFTYQRALQRFDHLNDYTLRDIGLWREPESRVDEWWMMNPPP
ncbi:hypothetical protein VB618_10770 [Microvirga sp. CF3062]|uniref:hypothetical protein n=1 Tax=Microvirga sp. CF3062 TaxID=3110182 RepID=UPI002E78C238|nr:hypothetical protein [Microvirga sp. CF3062]MEE1656683.1 hypothetical protein [Microvirga sp. CF3062]